MSFPEADRSVQINPVRKMIRDCVGIRLPSYSLAWMFPHIQPLESVALGREDQADSSPELAHTTETSPLSPDVSAPTENVTVHRSAHSMASLPLSPAPFDSPVVTNPTGEPLPGNPSELSPPDTLLNVHCVLHPVALPLSPAEAAKSLPLSSDTHPLVIRINPTSDPMRSAVVNSFLHIATPGLIADASPPQPPAQEPDDPPIIRLEEQPPRISVLGELDFDVSAEDSVSGQPQGLSNVSDVARPLVEPYTVAVTIRNMEKRGTATWLFPNTAAVRDVHARCTAVWRQRYFFRLDDIACLESLPVTKFGPSQHRCSALTSYVSSHSVVDIPDSRTTARRARYAGAEIHAFNVLTSQQVTMVLSRTTVVADFDRHINTIWNSTFRFRFLDND